MHPRLFALVLVALAACGTEGPPIAAYAAPVPALLVLDLQRDFLEADGRLPIEPAQVEPLLDGVRAAVAGARGAGVTVVQIDNGFAPGDVANLFRNQAAVGGSPGAEWDPRVPLEADARFTKASADAFSVGALDAWLRERQVDHLVLTGVFADGCVLATSLGALNRRYRVTVVSSAVGAASAGARASALETMRGRGVRVVARADEVPW